MKRLHLSPDFSIPAEAITQTFGKRGSGKSNLGTVMAEEMHKAGLPFVVVDPVSAWYGLRSSADGKAPGLPIPIFGGEHGDVPLERTGGTLLADLVVDERLSCVLDVSEFSEGDKIRFLIDFAERLFRRNRDPLHMFLEERKVLAAVAQMEHVSRKQLSVLTGYKRSSRDTYLQRLSSKGLVKTDGTMVEITDEGLSTSVHEPLPQGEALRDYWMARLPEGEKKVLAVLLDAYPSTVERERLSDETGYKRSSRDTYLQRLGARQLIERVGGEIRASETLFDRQHVPA